MDTPPYMAMLPYYSNLFSNMKKSILILLFIPLLLVEHYLFSTIGDLVTAKSDMAVISGALLLSLFIFGNYLLVKYIIKLFKK